MSGGYGIVANVADADSALRLGAKVTILAVPGDPAKVVVRGISRGGRWVTKWTATKRLTNVRVAWVEKPNRESSLTFLSREEAEAVIAARFGSGASKISTGKKET